MKKKFTKLLMLLGVFLFLGAGSASAKKVYFQKPSDWTQVAVYTSGSWPGSVTTTTITTTNGATYYVGEIANDAGMVIFNNNNNGKQTQDLMNPGEGYVYGPANVKDSGHAKPIGLIAKNYDGSYTFSDEGHYYFPVSTYNVSQAYLYTWGSEIAGSHPGTKLNKETINGTEYWVYTNKVGNLTGNFDGIQLNTGGNSNQNEWKKIDLRPGDVIDVNSSSGVIGYIEPQGIKNPNVYMVFKGDDFEPVNDAFKFDKINDNEWTLTTQLKKGDYIFKMYDQGKNGAKYPTGTKLTAAKDNYVYIVEPKYPNNGDALTLTVPSDCFVTFKYYASYKNPDDNNRECARIQVENTMPIPTQMYLYGHINNDYWDKDNYVKLTKVDGTNKFTAEKVEISGFWTPRECDMVNKDANGNIIKKEGDEGYRAPYSSTGDENYVALYDHVNTNPKFNEANTNSWKFGSKESENNYKDIYGNNTNLKVTSGVAYSLVYQLEEIKNNFVVAKGIYNVEVDLDKGTVTFTEVKDEKEKVLKRTFVWYFGDDANDENADATPITKLTDEKHDFANGHAVHTFTYGDDKRDVIQAGIGTNPEHRLARQVQYTIWYREPRNSSNGINKRRAGETDSDEVIEPIVPTAEAVTSQPEGFRKAVETSYEDGKTILGDITIIGSPNYNDNHLIQLNKAGDYVITATIDVNDKNVNTDGFTYEVTPTSLYATVAQAPFSSVVASIGTSTATFKDQTSTYTLNGFLELKEELSENDFTVTVEPDETKGFWVNKEGYSYEKAFGGDDENSPFYSLFQQLTNLFEPNTDLNAVVVDGLYTGITNQKLTPAAPTNNPCGYNLSADFPCSGVYKITVTAKENSNYTGSEEGTFTIVPNLYGTFGTGTHADKGFNIEGYTFEIIDDAYTIKIPESAINGFLNNKIEDYIKKVNAFIPGTYFPSVFTEYTGSTKSKTAATAEGDSNNGSYAPNADNYKTGIDLSSLTGDNGETQHTITARIAKNGAEATYKFLVVKTTEDNDFTRSTTGVDTIGAEDNGEAVYYNLQGVRVMNPERGIFIKVANGRSEKVVL